jgi:hypothetical protein
MRTDFYCNSIMDSGKKISCSENSQQIRLTIQQRLLAALVLPSAAIVFAVLHFAALYKWVFYPFPCGFKVRFGLPCPTCGMTTSVLAFARGEILQSFYIQPATAAFCCIFILMGIFSIAAAICGTDWGIVRSIKLKYIIVTLIILVAGGWAVTMARAIAGTGH